MEAGKPKRSDLDIIRDFDGLFSEIPEPQTDDEITIYLNESGYDIEELNVRGTELINSLLASNWRFVSSQDIDDLAIKINQIPLRTSWKRSQLLSAIEKVSNAFALKGSLPVMAFRNLEELTDADLALILQELEYKAFSNGLETGLS